MRKFEILGSNWFNPKTRVAKVVRLNSNDCWNVALALALNLEYEDIRKTFKPYINNNGSLNGRYSHPVLLKNGYEELRSHGYKTPRALADDNEYSKYEYVVSTKGHLVYIRKGVIYDGFNSDLKRIKLVYRRKISNRRNLKYDFIR